MPYDFVFDLSVSRQNGLRRAGREMSQNKSSNSAGLTPLQHAMQRNLCSILRRFRLRSELAELAG